MRLSSSRGTRGTAYDRQKQKNQEKKEAHILSNSRQNSEFNPTPRNEKSG